MSARLLLIAAILVALVSGCGGAKTIDAFAVKDAFTRQGVKLDVTTDPGQLDEIGRVLLRGKGATPSYLLFHMTGAAIAGEPHVRSVVVFDDPYWASQFAARSRKLRWAKYVMVRVARNVVYVGDNDADAREALKEVAGPD